MPSVKMTDNSGKVLSALDAAVARALEEIGGRAETHAKELCPVGTPESTGKKGYRGSTLRNSITHRVDGKTVAIGTDVHYAPYVELGTGTYFTPPPEWMENNAERGKGIGHSFVHPRPYLRPAIENYQEEYKQVLETELGR